MKTCSLLNKNYYPTSQGTLHLVVDSVRRISRLLDSFFQPLGVAIGYFNGPRPKSNFLAVIGATALAFCFGGSMLSQAQSPSTPNLTVGASAKLISPSSTADSIWIDDIGSGFHTGVEESGFEIGASFGHRVFGGKLAHDFVLSKIHWGMVMGDVVGENHWYQGNWELRGELMFGEQYRPKETYLVGLTPILRYTFATNGVWTPFMDAGSGVTATGIGRPDLGSTFQFNSQVGFGVRRFLDRNTALTLQYRFMHISNAGIREPNFGVNASLLFAGFNWFF